MLNCKDYMLIQKLYADIFCFFCRVLCETVKNFVAKVGEDQEKDGDESEESITQKVRVCNTDCPKHSL